MSGSSKIWLSSPHMGDSEQAYVQNAFDTNWIAPLGPHVQEFEEAIESYNGVKAALALNSGTGAIHLAMDLLDVGPGDHVLVQSFTFCGTVNPVIYRGAQAVFIDSERDTWNMDPEALKRAIHDLEEQGKLSSIKAILPVHLYGMPAKMDELMTIAKTYDIPIVEDAAESLGSSYKGKMTGSFGRMGVYSFNGNKIITTSGGGALVSDDQELIDRAFHLSTQARDEAPHYQHSKVGYNYRLSNVLAGIGCGQMKVLDERVAQRRANFDRYIRFFSDWKAKGFRFGVQEQSEDVFCNRWLSALLVDPNDNGGLTREDLRIGMAEDNIECRPLWKPMHMQPVFREVPFYTAEGKVQDENGKASVCGDLFEKGLCLPSGSNLSSEDWQRIETKLDELLSKALD